MDGYVVARGARIGTHRTRTCFQQRYATGVDRFDDHIFDARLLHHPLVRLVQAASSRSIIQALILIVAVVIVLVNISIRTLECQLGVPFSTNVLTGECVVSGCGPPRVWYHTSGCALSDEQRMKLLEREGWLDRPRESCMQRCETSPQLFCDPWLLRHEFHLPDLTCSDLVDCDIECPDMR